MSRNNEIGFFNWFGYRLPFAERLKHIREAGFRNISIWLGDEEDLVTENNTGKLCKIADEFGLNIECAHAPYTDCNNIWSPDKMLRQKIYNIISESIKFCSIYKIPLLVMHVTAGDHAPLPNEYGHEFMRQIVNIAEAENVVIAIENTRKPENINYLLSSIDTPFLGLCYDSSHDFIHSETPGLMLKKWGHRLVYTHFSDNDGLSDKHWIPGTGIIDWEIIRKNFPRNWNKTISLEVVPKTPETENIDEFLAEAKKAGIRLQSLLVG